MHRSRCDLILETAEQAAVGGPLQIFISCCLYVEGLVGSP